MDKIKHRVGIGISVISVIFVAWVFASFIDINTHNMTDQKFSSWNFFEICLSGRMESR